MGIGPITYQGRTQSVRQWAKEIGISDMALYGRLKRGWSLEEALDSTSGEQEIARRQAISTANKGRPRTEEWLTRASETFKAQYASGERQPTGGTHDTPEAKERQRQIALKQHAEGKVNKDGLTKGRSRTRAERQECWTDEKREAQAGRTLKAYKDGRMIVHGRYKGYWSIYDGPKGIINMRSRSEVIFARDLDAQGIDWSYEPQRFDLGWSTYCPDFHLLTLDRWIEIKGHQTDLAWRKVEEFARTHFVSVVLAQDLLRLERVNS